MHILISLQYNMTIQFGINIMLWRMAEAYSLIMLF